MQKVLLIGFLAIISISSCKKGASSSASLSGKYTEYSPMSGETQLEFIPGNIMIKTETGSAYRDSFYYTLGSSTISLTPAWSNIYPASNFDFAIIDYHTIRIQNLYASIPEAPETFMIFMK